MGDTETTTTAEFALSQGQLDDLALLLAKCLGRGNMTWLANSALGPQAVQQAGNDVDDINVFAAKVVKALHEAGRIPKALELLRREGHRNGLLTLGVKHILSGNRLDDDAALQAFVNEYEPFLGSAAMMDLLPKVGRTVCAVALGDPLNAIRGSGFLIAPDVVITNFHVMEPFLKVDDVTGAVSPNGSGDQIFFFFDYLFAPAPNVSERGRGHTSVCVSAAQDWLLKARVWLKGDGTHESPATVSNEYDYAVIRLERPVGKQPSRRSGGAIRGWLQPEESIDVLTANRRVLVFQHPQALAQQFDVGDYVQLDPSSSRVWYTVSTAHGSSGGAAVDTDGRLFALHNAEVKTAVPAALGKRVNQGIRIDLITKDLAAVVNREAVPADDGTLFWSLNDDLTDPHPIIGRAAFKGLVTHMRAPDAERVLVVTGPPQSGLQFSIKLLRRTLGRNVPVAIFTPKQLQELTTPKVFLRALVENLGVIGTSGRPFPELPTTENVPGWLRKDLPQWLLELLSKDEELNPTKYPAWVVINTVVPKDESFLWADHLRDLIAALVGVHDSDNPGVDLPQLRWLFLAKDPDAETNPVALPVGGVRQLAEDLGAETAYVADYTECLQNAWRSNNREADLNALIDIFNTLGQMTLNTNDQQSPDKRLPPRRVLAEHVRELIKLRLLMGGGVQ